MPLGEPIQSVLALADGGIISRCRVISKINEYNNTVSANHNVGLLLPCGHHLEDLDKINLQNGAVSFLQHRSSILEAACANCYKDKVCHRAE